MHSPANQAEFKAAVDPAVEELNRIVDQAEALLRSLGRKPVKPPRRCASGSTKR